MQPEVVTAQAYKKWIYVSKQKMCPEIVQVVSLSFV